MIKLDLTNRKIMGHIRIHSRHLWRPPCGRLRRAERQSCRSIRRIPAPHPHLRSGYASPRSKSLPAILCEPRLKACRGRRYDPL